MNNNLKKVLFLFCATIVSIGCVGTFINNYNPTVETVEVVSEKMLIPCGQSIGIKMNVKGVLVVGLEEIETENSIVNPGLDAGLQVGDVILSINGQDVYYAYEVTDILKKSDGTLVTKILRNDQEHVVTVNAAKDYETGEYMLGVWVKEKIAGIGTLTYYDPDNNIFAALGHGIYERKTSTLINAGSGQLLKTQVKSIKEGTTGTPGEIRGIFYNEELPLGNVIKNTKYGIFAEGINNADFNNENALVIGTIGAFFDTAINAVSASVGNLGAGERRCFVFQVSRSKRSWQ